MYGYAERIISLVTYRFNAIKSLKSILKRDFMKKRADGRYQLSVMIGYKDDGTPKRKLVYGNTQKETQEKANALRIQHSMGIDIDSDIRQRRFISR